MADELGENSSDDDDVAVLRRYSLCERSLTLRILPTRREGSNAADCFRLLLYQRATAIQYQCYVLCATQAGAHNPTRTSWGEALAFDPWGKELGRLRSVDDFERDGGDREGVMPGEFILCEVDEGLVE